MSGKAAKVVITERQQVVLQKFSRSKTVAYRLRQRASVILLAFEGKLNSEIEGLLVSGTIRSEFGDGVGKTPLNGSRLSNVLKSLQNLRTRSKKFPVTNNVAARPLHSLANN